MAPSIGPAKARFRGAMSLVDAGSGRFTYRVEAKHIGWRRKVTLCGTYNMSDDQ